jgi:hypothetical protein
MDDAFDAISNDDMFPILRNNTDTENDYFKLNHAMKVSKHDTGIISSYSSKNTQLKANYSRD